MINVIVPDTDETNLPVMANIHGGGYQGGGGNMLTSDALVELGNVIVVNFNYRLGVHGFLCLGTENIPGNAGMKDIVVALHWIKENIAKFGGNPDDVSLNGYSAGGSAVELLTLSKTTVGLYNKIIPESGSGLSPWSVQIDPLANAKRYARLLNFTNVDDTLALEEFYKTITYEKLFSHAYLEERDTNFVFVPCVERDTGREMFLKEAPEEIMKKGNFPKLPALKGFANMEGIARTLVFEVWKNEMNENFADFLPVDLQFESRNQKEEVANKIKNFYFGDRPVGDDTLQEYINLFSDIMFNFPAMRSIKYQIEAGNENVYLYEYSYVDDAILEKSLYPHVRGACMHDLPSGSFFNETESYLKLKYIMKKIWINFIKTGIPVPETNSDFPESWPPVTSANGAPYMDLNLPSTLHKTPLLEERMRFWDEVYGKYYHMPIAPPNLKGKRFEL